jgi:hypothetical protein
MASLQNTTVNGTLTASTSFTSPKILNNSSVNYMLREYGGTVSIPSSVNSATNYVDLFGNTGAHNRMYGFCSWTVGQSQIHNGSFYWQLSEYGFSIQTLTSSVPSYWIAERYNPSYGTNYCRFYNNIGTSWGNGTYYFVLNIQGPGDFTSSYLTQRTR